MSVANVVVVMLFKLMFMTNIIHDKAEKDKWEQEQKVIGRRLGRRNAERNFSTRAYTCLNSNAGFTRRDLSL